MIPMIIFVLLWIASIQMTNGIATKSWTKFFSYVIGFVICLIIGASIGS